MQPFFVSPTESLLLGLCCGEFLRDHDALFVDVLRRRLKPFVPSFREAQRVQIAQDDIPADVDLSASWIEGWIGRSPSHANMLFGMDNKGAFRIVWDTSRRSVVDLLSIYLGDSIARRFWDQMDFPIKDGFEVPQNILSHMQPMSMTEDQYQRFMEKQGSDDCDAIAKSLGLLAQHNESEAIFKAGLLFGELVAICKELENCCWEPANSHSDEEIVRDSFQPVVELLIASPLVKNNHHAHSMLNRCLTAPPVWQGGPGDFEDVAYHTLQGINDARAAIWLAFGEVIGILRESDRLARTVEWTGTAPRTFKDLFDASGDKVRRAIQDAERELNEGATGIDVAEKVVRSLANAIEAIARRIWRIEAMNAHKIQGKLFQLLMDKRQSSNGLDERFASVAINLYKSYRNPAVHEFDSFTCTVEEARYFVAGMRVLLDLAKQIELQTT